MSNVCASRIGVCDSIQTIDSPHLWIVPIWSMWYVCMYMALYHMMNAGMEFVLFK